VKAAFGTVKINYVFHASFADIVAFDLLRMVGLPAGKYPTAKTIGELEVLQNAMYEFITTKMYGENSYTRQHSVLGIYYRMDMQTASLAHDKNKQKQFMDALIIAHEIYLRGLGYFGATLQNMLAKERAYFENYACRRQDAGEDFATFLRSKNIDINLYF
jgi:hypothetical protein